MKQKDDQNIARALINFAKCCLSDNDIDLFMSRIILKQIEL